MPKAAFLVAAALLPLLAAASSPPVRCQLPAWPGHPAQVCDPKQSACCPGTKCVKDDQGGEFSCQDALEAPSSSDHAVLAAALSAQAAQVSAQAALAIDLAAREIARANALVAPGGDKPALTAEQLARRFAAVQAEVDDRQKKKNLPKQSTPPPFDWKQYTPPPAERAREHEGDKKQGAKKDAKSNGKDDAKKNKKKKDGDDDDDKAGAAAGGGGGGGAGFDYSKYPSAGAGGAGGGGFDYSKYAKAGPPASANVERKQPEDKHAAGGSGGASLGKDGASAGGSGSGKDGSGGGGGASIGKDGASAGGAGGGKNGNGGGGGISVDPHGVHAGGGNGDHGGGFGFDWPWDSKNASAASSVNKAAGGAGGSGGGGFDYSKYGKGDGKTPNGKAAGGGGGGGGASGGFDYTKKHVDQELPQGETPSDPAGDAAGDKGDGVNGGGAKQKPEPMWGDDDVLIQAAKALLDADAALRQKASSSGGRAEVLQRARALLVEALAVLDHADGRSTAAPTMGGFDWHSYMPGQWGGGYNTGDRSPGSLEGPCGESNGHSFGPCKDDLECLSGICQVKSTRTNAYVTRVVLDASQRADAAALQADLAAAGLRAASAQLILSAQGVVSHLDQASTTKNVNKTLSYLPPSDSPTFGLLLIGCLVVLYFVWNRVAKRRNYVPIPSDGWGAGDSRA